MLSFLRRQSQSVLIKGLLITIALSFLIGFGAFGYVNRSMRRAGKHFGDEATWLAKINGQPIAPIEVGRMQEELQTRYRRQYGEFADTLLQRMDMTGIALNKIVNDRVLEILAEKMGLTVTDAELADMIYMMPQFQSGKGFDSNRYIQTLRRQRTTAPEYEANLRRQMIADKLRTLVISSAKVADSDVREAFDNQEDKINLQFVRLSPELLGAPVQISDDQLKQYFEANKEKFRVPEKRKVNYATFKPADYADKIMISADQVRAYYDANKDKEFKQPEQVQARHILIAADASAGPAVRDAAKAKAEKLRKEIVGGADFAELAKKNSDDPGTKDKGGDLGWFGRGQMVKAFEDTAFAAKPGEVSDVVESQYGYHIIQVMAKRPEKVQELSEVQDKIQADLKKEEGAKRALADATAFKQKVTGTADLLKVGADQGVKVASSSAFAMNQAIPDVLRGMEAARKVFELKLHDVSDPFDAGEAVYVFQVAEVIDAHLPEFAEAADQAREALRVELEQKALAEKAAGIISLVQSGQPLGKAAGALDVEETGLFTRSGGAVPKVGMAPELMEAAFTATRPGMVLPKSYPSGNGVVVAVLKERVKPTDAEFQAKADEIRGQLVEKKAEITLQAWVEQAKKSMKILTNEEALAALRAANPATSCICCAFVSEAS